MKGGVVFPETLDLKVPLFFLGRCMVLYGTYNNIPHSVVVVLRWTVWVGVCYCMHTEGGTSQPICIFTGGKH